MGHLGAVLGLSWATVGPTWGYPGVSWAILGPSWGHLGRSWAHLRPISGLAGASLAPSWPVLGPRCAVSALSGRLLGPFFPISEPRSTLISASGRIWGHLGALWGRFWLMLGPIGAQFEAYVISPWAYLGSSSSLSPATNRKYQKGGRRCIAAGVFDKTTLYIHIPSTLYITGEPPPPGCRQKRVVPALGKARPRTPPELPGNPTESSRAPPDAILAMSVRS